MKSTISHVLSNLGEVAGIEVAEPHERTQIVLLGAYDAGKSSLIKRLLVEAELPVPEWLTIAASPETNQKRAVKYGTSQSLLDTPGIRSGLQQHEDEAQEAALEADVLVLLLLPNLLTSDKEEILALVSGRQVHAGGWPWPPGACKILISQLDQGGIDPQVDPVSFVEYSETKKAELQAILEREGITGEITIHSVVADLFGEVGNDTRIDEIEIKATDYIRGEWDGVDALIGALSTIDNENMREAGAIRRTVATAASESSAAVLAAKALEADAKFLQVNIDDLEALVRERAKKLDSAVADLLVQLDQFSSSIFMGDATGGAESWKSDQKDLIQNWFEAQQAWLEGKAEFEGDPLGDAGASNPESGGPMNNIWATVDGLIARQDRISEAAQLLIFDLFRKNKFDLAEEIAGVHKQGAKYFKDENRHFVDLDSVETAEKVLAAAAAIPLLIEAASILRDFVGSKTPDHEAERVDVLEKIKQQNQLAVDRSREILAIAMNEVNAVTSSEIEVLQVRKRLASESGSAARKRSLEIEEAIRAVREALG